MFGWLKDKAQNGVYGTTINAIARGYGGDPAAIAAINVCAALTVVQTIRRLRDPVMFFDDILHENPSIATFVDSHACYEMENFCLTAANQARAQSKMSGHIFQLAAGYFGMQKRHAFQGEIPSAVVSAIRVGARTCQQLGITEETPMSEALPHVISTLGSALNR